jgi:DNA-binding Xre family transcriptional regulator
VGNYPPFILSDMNDSIDRLDRTIKLQQLMQAAGIDSFKELYRVAGTSARTIAKIRSGELVTIRWQTLINISNSLQISPIEFIEIFGDGSIGSNRQELATIKQEYARLQQQLQQQRETLQAEFQYQSLQVLESFLTYFPTAKHAATNNPDFPASKIFPLVSAIDRLLAQWGVSTIGTVGAEIPYDPQYHQPIEGTAIPGDSVTVRYLGYRQGDKLLFRAKVQK